VSVHETTRPANLTKDRLGWGLPPGPKIAGSSLARPPPSHRLQSLNDVRLDWLVIGREPTPQPLLAEWWCTFQPVQHVLP
jgi:hypothetical protein